MLKVILNDGAEIENCLPGTTSDNIIHGGETFSDAATILDVITPENSTTIKVVDEDGKQVAFSSDVILNDGGIIGTQGEYKTVTVTLRHKTELERINDQIAELQEVVIEG